MDSGDSGRAFAGYLARLLSQLIREPVDLAARESALRALRDANTVPVTLAWEEWRLRSNGEMLPPGAPELHGLAARMAAHEVRVMSFGAGTPAAHLLGAVGILAQDPVIGDGGENAVVRLRLLGAESITFVPVLAPSGAEPDAPRPRLSSRQREDTVPLPGIDDFELADIDSEPLSPGERARAAARRASGRSVSALPAVAGSAEELVARLAAAGTVGQALAVLDPMVKLSEGSTGDVSNALTVLMAIIAHERRFSDADLRLSFRAARKRIASPRLFQRLAEGLPDAGERYQDYMAVFSSGGDEGVDALIDALVNAESARERRVFFDALVALRRGIQTLIHMLGDRRWFVARNAAELLGEMRATEAEHALVAALRYDDPRVRRSATVALARLATPGARAALSAAMHDPSANIRMQATMAVLEHPAAATLPTVISALADEQDPDVQRTLLVALGKIGTPEAVRRLIAAAAPDRGLFKRKPVAFRLAAVGVLADIKTHEARAAIQVLTKDREAPVREAALKAIRSLPPSSPPTSAPRASWGG